MKRLLYILFLIFFFLISGELLTRSVLKFDPGERFADRTSLHPYLRKDWVPGFNRIYSGGGTSPRHETAGKWRRNEVEPSLDSRLGPGQARGPQPQQAFRSPRRGYLPGVQTAGKWRRNEVEPSLDKVGRIGNQTETFEFKINPFGFRAESMKTALKPQNTQRIFFLGESTTECITLSENDAFPSRLEKLLDASHPDQKFECINAAMSGNLAADSLAALIYKVMYYQPDIVVVMHAINDLRYGTVPSYDPVSRRDFQRSFYFAQFYESGNSAGFFRTWMRHSHFLTFLKRRIWAGIRESDVQAKWNETRKKRQSVPFTKAEPSQSLDDFLKYLEEMVFIARGHGVRIILMTEPSIYRENLSPEIDEKLWLGYLPGPGINLSNEFLAREMKRFNDAIRELSRRTKIEMIDLERGFPKDLTYFYDDVHFTPEGSRRAAGIIFQYLREP